MMKILSEFVIEISDSQGMKLGGTFYQDPECPLKKYWTVSLKKTNYCVKFHNIQLFFQSEMGKQFDPKADEFTLEKIIEFGFDQYAEQIGEVSGAARKELAIEQVGGKS